MIDDPLVKSLLTNVVEDESNLSIVQALIDGVKTDEEIAEKTEIKLNVVRKILYKLYDLGLATYKRSKDPETQWFTYSWRFEEQEVINHIKSDSEQYLKMLNEELEKEEDTMYYFICPECGEELEFFDNTSLIKQIKDDIKTVESNYKSFTKKVDA